MGIKKKAKKKKGGWTDPSTQSTAPRRDVAGPAATRPAESAPLLAWAGLAEVADVPAIKYCGRGIGGWKSKSEIRVSRGVQVGGSVRIFQRLVIEFVSGFLVCIRETAGI